MTECGGECLAIRDVYSSIYTISYIEYDENIMHAEKVNFHILYM